MREIEIRSNEAIVRNFELRSTANFETHKYFHDRGYLEAETPILTPKPEIAPVRQFQTTDGLNEYYLRMTDTEYLRRLLTCGFPNLYQLSKHFRVNDQSNKSLPEFTQLSVASRGANYIDMVSMVRNYMIDVAKTTTGLATVNVFGQTIDMSDEWKTLTMKDALKEYADIDLDLNLDPNNLEQTMRRKGLEIPIKAAQYLGVIRYNILMESILDNNVINNFRGILFLTEFPYEFGGPGKEVAGRPAYKQRGEVFFNGVEMMNGVSTQTDGIKLRNRYTETLDCQLESGLWSGKELDDEYLAAIELGIPESAAISLGYDRFIMALTSNNNIKEVVLYPEIK